jgi:cob(I)alamin adenosyltransferase
MYEKYEGVKDYSKHLPYSQGAGITLGSRPAATCAAARTTCRSSARSLADDDYPSR